MFITLQSFCQPRVSDSGAALLLLISFMLINKSQDMIFLVYALENALCSNNQVLFPSQAHKVES